MRQFDSYISEITKDLKLTTEQKNDLEEEFRDHLHMLKKEFIIEGMSEDAAIEKAIKSFGNSSALRKQLLQNSNKYKSIHMSLLGLLLTILIIRIGSYIVVPGYTLNTKISLLYILIPMFLFIPFGYFLPILLNKASSIKTIILLSMPLSLTLGVVLSIIINSFGTITILYVAGGLTGILIGYTILILLNWVVNLLIYSEKII